ncbi:MULTISPECIES: terminase small subunit [Zhenhengia]|uniref:Terminase small subunit n=1 Tax=Zhenhengia yiwuensis TaxID=2763666 RepID=A0A926EM96_9FIRM|nr:terminase small subunit [Zhenhengia yiwuensis]
MKLTLKQKAFADYYIQTGNATESAIKAGYSKKTAGVIGDENLKKPYIKKYIEERLEQISSDRIADAKEVMEYLTAVMRGQTLSEIVVVEGCGDGCSEARRIDKAPDEKERIKAAELIGKRYSMWTDKVEANVQQQVVFCDEQELED